MKDIFSALIIFLVLFGKATAQEVDTVHSYTAFQIYSGNADSVYLDHPRYFGLFLKDTCSSGNFATTVKSKNSCYQRVAPNYSPRFLELGRQSPLPILGGVMVEEVDAINGAAYLAHIDGGDTLLIDSFYHIDRPVFLFDNVTYLGTNESSGFIRSDPPVTVLKRNAESGDDKIIVESNDGFRKLQRINIFSGRGYDELSSFTSYSGSVSTFLGGDTTIFLSGLKVQRAMSIGDTVSLLYPMITPLFGTSDNILIKNLTFNGNRAENSFSYDWRVATTIVTPSSENLTIEKCSFKEIPSENIFMCGAAMIDCEGLGFNGSVVHFSCQSGEFETQVLYNDFNSTNEAGDSIMEHSEASMTFSAKVQNLRVSYNNLYDIQEKGVGNFANDDFLTEITDNVFSSEKEVIGYVPFYDRDSLISIYNNKNPLRGSQSVDDCAIRSPNATIPLMCNSNSSQENPLKIGDTITIVLDSIFVLNTNENYLKCIQPVYSEAYFMLHSMSLKSDHLTSYHLWETNLESERCNGIFFDNGHRDGAFAKGNWGYEGCANNDCNELTLKFVVHTLPESPEEVSCPLEGLVLKFDGQIGTWEEEITCSNSIISFSDELGSPFLNGTTSIYDVENSLLVLYPNPVNDFLFIENSNNELLEIEVYDTSGAVLASYKTFSDKIDLSKLPTGMYHVRIIRQNKISVYKILKIKGS